MITFYNVTNTTMLPLLVKEKVNFYYYFDKWKENIKIMHDEYNTRVEIRDEPDGNLVVTELRFKQSDGITSNIHYLQFLFANKNFEDVMGPPKHIYNFTRNSKPQSAPLNYRYSSGRNNRNGYY